MAPIIIDVETCGFYGQPVLLQYAEGDGPIILYNLWTNPIFQTLELIEKIANHPDGVVGFNLAFDWFHLCKFYTLIRLWKDKSEYPENVIQELAELELEARDGPCLKPVKSCDVFLQARKTHYQSLLDRNDIRIKRVPTQIAWILAEELEKRIELKDVYFAKRKDKNRSKWSVLDIKDDRDDVIPHLKDLVLRFAPSSGLKALAADALGIKTEEMLLFGDVSIPKDYLPTEYGYAPFAAANGANRSNYWLGAWPNVISHHISHWNYSARAREYASADVRYTWELYKFFGSPELGDDDSTLACCVAACRWKGFRIDIEKLKSLKQKALAKIGNTPTAPKPVFHYVLSFLSDTERAVIKTKFRENSYSTKKPILEEIVKFKVPCPDCNKEAEINYVETVIDSMIDDDAPDLVVDISISGGKKDCETCKGLGSVPHIAASKAQEVLDARSGLKEIEIYDKLIMAGRFHADFKVIGSLSNRMAGASGLNAQGIKKTKEVRRAFPLFWEGYQLDAGDYSGYEITLAEACYGDLNLRRDLLTCEVCEGEVQRVGEKVEMNRFLDSTGQKKYKEWRAIDELEKIKKAATKGEVYVPKVSDEIMKEIFENDFICKSCGSNKAKKIHALFGTHVFPGMTYEQIKATDGTDNDLYTKCKQAVFALLYGGTGETLADRLGVDIEIANLAMEKFMRVYPMVGVARQKITNAFCSMKQANGIGTKVEWHEPAEFIESMFGFKRYFTLENRICKTLFELANKPPKSWKDIKIKVVRRDREQTGSGAAQSALYAAAFAIQASNTRAAQNHVIQSSGATITKTTQRKIWDIQPSGVSEWIVQVLNVHDELQSIVKPEYSNKVRDVVNDTVESFRSKVSLIRMDWLQNLNSWADK